MISDIRSERLVLKEKAINYFKESGIPKIIEKSLNDLCNVMPDDACGYLSKYFEKLSLTPKLSKIEATEITGDFGNSGIAVKLFAIFRNEEIEIVNLTIPNNLSIKPGESFSFDNIKTHENVIKGCIEIINQDLAKLCLEIDPKKFEEVEQLLKNDAMERQTKYETDLQPNKDNEISGEDSKKEDIKNKVVSGKIKKTPVLVCISDDPPEIICQDLRAHFALSIAMSTMASVLENENMFKYTKNRVNVTSDQSNLGTLPALPVLSNGKGFPGKCQVVRKCYIIPNGLYGPSKQIAADLRLVCLKIWASVQTKFPTTTVNDRCEMVPPFDRPEQFLDVIQDVLKETELEERIKVILDISANTFFDFSKGKYEIISGQLKSSEELATLFKDLVERYQSVVGLVNPLRKQDTDPWNNLAKSLNNRCWIIGRSPVFPRAQKIADSPQIIEECLLKVSMVGLEIDGYSLYDDYIKVSKQLLENDEKLCVWLEDLCGQNWLLDIACGLHAYLVMLPSLRSSCGANKLDGWIELMSQYPMELGLNFPDLFQELVPPEEEKQEL